MNTPFPAFKDTESFSFRNPEPGVVELDFGGLGIRMTEAAARDLAYRLESYLIFLAKGPASPPETAENRGAENGNVLSLFPRPHPAAPQSQKPAPNTEKETP
jgi:hypothetical protein